MLSHGFVAKTTQQLEPIFNSHIDSTKLDHAPSIDSTKLDHAPFMHVLREDIQSDATNRFILCCCLAIAVSQSHPNIYRIQTFLKS